MGAPADSQQEEAAVLFGSAGELPPAGEVIPMVLLAAVVFDVLILLPEAIAFRAGVARAYATRTARSTA